jgi:type VI secretion system protein ImpF
MPRTDNEARITPSVLDRLIDYEPEMSREAIASRSKSMRQLKQSVKRDLEWLLNTRQTAGAFSPELREVATSLAAFGLPDFTSVSVKSPADRLRMQRALEAAINIFEPRLEGVIVTLQPMENSLQQSMHFRVDARLRVEPAPEPVTFDTVLQLNSGEYLVKED